MTVPRPPAFDGQTFGDTLDKHLRKPDGSGYAVFQQFKPWKVWADRLRDYVETNRRTLIDHKTDLDEHMGRLNDLEARMAAVEAQPVTRFP